MKYYSVNTCIILTYLKIIFNLLTSVKSSRVVNVLVEIHPNKNVLFLD